MSFKKILRKSENSNQLKEISKWFLRDTEGNLDATRFHSFGIGLMDGLGHHKKGYRLKSAKNLFPDVDEKPHYYDVGYFIANRGKYAVVLLPLGGML